MRKSSLNLLNFDDTEFGSIHPIWNTEPYSTLSACIKYKLACNTYTLQCDKSKFSKRQVSAICPLCGTEEEIRLHFVLRYYKLNNVRNHFIQRLKTFIKDVVSTKLYDELFSSEIDTLQSIIDCSGFHFLTRGEIFTVECITRGLCFKLHQVRSTLLRMLYGEIIVIRRRSVAGAHFPLTVRKCLFRSSDNYSDVEFDIDCHESIDVDQEHNSESDISQITYCILEMSSQYVPVKEVCWDLSDNIFVPKMKDAVLSDCEIRLLGQMYSTLY
ncbi:unnamed protein product [Mytilus coruscus]|uniref:Uncharacterized protein n=1 Tax=Mytilus coruscus TaxID=42192 RepID=A0A6J8DUY3_MYTCO|nr:unnamed protein product [Mytilus coruscus]